MGTKKARLAVLAVVMAGVGALVLPSAFAGDVNGDKPAQDEKLGQVLKLIEIAKGNLADINAGWADPPEPSKPALRALLADIMTDCAAIDAHALEIEAKLADR